jgi:hypothetical protein
LGKELKRRTFRKLRSSVGAADHHHVYVVLLDDAVRTQRGVRAANPRADPSKPCVYVGMTGLDPKQRLANHKAGIKSASAVRRFGIQLLPKLFAHLNPMPYAAAVVMEADLAEDLRLAGYTVLGGH